MPSLSLNPEQQEAASHLQGPLLVLAGAGSGKTRIVTQRIAHLMEQGIAPENILALTFTNKAAQEMKERVERLTQNNVMILTFHSLGVRILKESLKHLKGYQENFTIYDEEDSLKLIKQVIEKEGINSKDLKTKTLKNLISRVKNHLLSPEDFISQHSHPLLQKHFCQLFKNYQNLLQQNQALDFDDLLYLVVKLFKERPDVLDIYQKRWPYLLIDEYQDTNQAQYMMAKMLAEPHHNLFVVGDPDQSIYSWRGANIENILRFEQDYPHSKKVKLEQNYRSSEIILEAANYLIQNNHQRLEKKLWSNQGPGDPISLFIAKDEREEAAFIVKKIEALHTRKNLSLQDVVIFYRTNFQSRVLEDKLLSYNLPYKIVGGLSFYQRREIKDVLAYMKILLNPHDLVAFKRTINLPKRGLGEQTLNKIIDYAHQQQLSLIDTLKKLGSLPFSQHHIRLSKKQVEGIESYLSNYEYLKKVAEEKLMQPLIEAIIEKGHFFEILQADKETYQDRKANLEEFIGKGVEKDQQDEPWDLAQFLDEISLAASADMPTQKEAISLMTIHNGKGLEYDTAFIIGLEEELFPHINAFESEAAIEEERRLCYVALTRAKKHLYLSASKFRFLWGGQRKMRPSRFLKELPGHCIQRIYLPYEAIPPPPEKETEPTDSQIFAPLEKVFHQDFGEGTIEEVHDGEMGIVYQVRFRKDNRCKKLLAQYAPLQAIK